MIFTLDQNINQKRLITNIVHKKFATFSAKTNRPKTNAKNNTITKIGPKIKRLKCRYNDGGMLLGEFKFDTNDHAILKDYNPIVLELCKDKIDEWLGFIKIPPISTVNFSKLHHVFLEHESVKTPSEIIIETLGLNLWYLSSLNYIDNLIFLGSIANFL